MPRPTANDVYEFILEHQPISTKELTKALELKHNALENRFLVIENSGIALLVNDNGYYSIYQPIDWAME